MSTSLHHLYEKVISKISKWKYAVLEDQVVIVHTLGKVGSSTIYYELKRISPWNNIFHTHFLSEEWLLGRLKKGNHFDFNNKAAQKVFSYLERYPDKQKKIITLVREPVSRELSNFMQNPIDFDDCDLLDDSIENLKEIYLKKLNYDYTFGWFDSEFYNYTGFDVFSKPFDKQKGFSIYQHEGIDILVLKLEMLDDCYSIAMQEFLGLRVTLKKSSNKSSQKPISNVYSRLRKEIKFTSRHLEKIYENKYVTHFYTKDEIDMFKAKFKK